MILAKGMQMLIPEDSPLRKPPNNLSRKQILILDGIRYAAEIADLAYQRLAANLQTITGSASKPSSTEIAMAIADAWTVVDSVHRFHDLVLNMPGLKNAPWRRLLSERTKDFLELRNSVQHQLGELNNLVSEASQIWGYLSWAEVIGERHTGKWLMISPGSHYAGDKLFFMGPNKLPFHVPLGRIRLNAFGKQVYLGRAVDALHDAIAELSNELSNGNVRSIDTPASNRRDVDMMSEGWITVEVSLEYPKKSSLDNEEIQNS